MYEWKELELKYNSDLVNNLKFMINDMIEFLDGELSRKDIDNRIKYVVDKFERMK